MSEERSGGVNNDPIEALVRLAKIIQSPVQAFKVVTAIAGEVYSDLPEVKAIVAQLRAERKELLGRREADGVQAA